MSSSAPVEDSVVRLRDAISLIGRFPALAGADLDVGSGEVVLLRGPNGAGKTTLLRLLSGLAPLSAGEGVVLGADLSDRNDRRALRRRVGLLGHGTSLYDDLTVEQNLAFWCGANGVGPAAIEPVMERLGLAGRLRTVPVSRLSAGQRRRTALAVVVSRRPQLWLLDEPHAGLDRAGRDIVDGLVRQAVSQGATAIVASHESDRVATLATRVVDVTGGRIVGEQPVPEGP